MRGEAAPCVRVVAGGGLEAPPVPAVERTRGRAVNLREEPPRPPHHPHRAGGIYGFQLVRANVGGADSELPVG